ncbi:translocation and assembly module lipoprotein TamL [Robertkochia sediminum]|uniref:translocation and assembly module lipoprotein TamL n=1 Tax=Robertkochia sediminum TaxID=2785326 RepID=UPI0019343E06|nr:BamA/TamA family outer membrane protein [Robertkochia sediminum]MBL7471720.1 BamA/TamA family outer membrane protein [Robertkochia sediminum]
MKDLYVKITVILLLTLIASCNAVKNVNEGEYLLRKNTILLNGEKIKDPEIEGIVLQQPNALSRLHIYNLAKPNGDSIYIARLQEKLEDPGFTDKVISPKQLAQIADYKIRLNNFIKRTGEAPVIINQKLTERSARRLKQYYDNRGYFNSRVTYEKDTANYGAKKAGMTYAVESMEPYLLDTIKTYIPSLAVDSIYKANIAGSHLKSEERFDLNNFSAERERLNRLFLNSGIYKFQLSSIAFDLEADTVSGSEDRKMPVTVAINDMVTRVEDTQNVKPYKVHEIDEVNIYADYQFNSPATDSIHHEGYVIWFRDKLKYKPSALTDVMAIAPGDIYRDRDRSLTARQIGNLQTFKYPNIAYRYREDSDSLLITNVYLSPRKRFSLGFNPEVSHSNIQDIGISLSTSLVSRNVFRGAETLEFALRGTIGSSSELSNAGENFFNIAEISGDIRLNFPRIVSPFNTSKIIPKYMTPQTRMSIGTIIQQNIGLDKQSVNGILRYNWSPTPFRKNLFELINIQFIRNLNTDRYFEVYRNSYNDLNDIADNYQDDLPADYFNEQGNLIIPEGTTAFTNEVLNNDFPVTENELEEVNRIEERRDRLTANNLILGSGFTWSKNNRQGFQDNNFYSFKTKFELAGNTLSLLSNFLNFPQNDNGQNEIFGVAYSQYVKTDIDFIKYWNLTSDQVLAFRSFLGIAIPYGNAQSIPFLRSYFAGGSNDNRAWEAYSLGPGRVDNLNDFNEANLKIALNLEYRFGLIGQFKGALFADAGNIWNVLDNVTQEEAVFEDLSSLSEIALGTGFGLRYDFSYFVFRFDIGFKTYNPAEQNGSRWFTNYNFANAVYNIGINYPF